MTSRRHLLGAALIGALPLTGCGFRLRGSYSTPFRTLYLQMPENSYLAVRLRQELLAGSDVTIVNTPSEAEAILELLSDSRSHDVLSINDTAAPVNTRSRSRSPSECRTPAASTTWKP